jgi:3-methyladenine DNA glycosylase AlkD
MSYNSIIKSLKTYTSSDKAKILAGFFKTGKGQYGEGDIFIGVTVPNQRIVAKKYFVDTSFDDIQKLLESKIHEHRLTGLFILVYKFEKANVSEQRRIYTFYLKNKQCINNWDLVDTTTPQIIGAYLLNKPTERKILYKLAMSKNLWERRIAILATYTFIKYNEFADTLAIAEILLHDSHDLIHKAVGWMLREVGKKNQKVEEAFLKKHYKTMPRTMLRYAIERFDEKKKAFYMKH